MDANQQSNTETRGGTRDKVTMIILIASLLGLFGLAGGLVWHALLCNDTDTAKSTFTTVLPVIGTWVGTLLAFYFGKENFDAAQKSVTDMAKGITGMDKLKSISVKDKMIPRSQIKLPDSVAQHGLGARLSEVVKQMDIMDIGRLPLFDANGVTIAVVHRSAIDQFVSQEVLRSTTGGGTTVDSTFLDGLTLTKLLADPDLGALVKEMIAFVGENAMLVDAKMAMDNISQRMSQFGNCEDLFVTKTGNAKEPVIGWVTNDIIVENAKV